MGAGVGRHCARFVAAASICACFATVSTAFASSTNVKIAPPFPTMVQVTVGDVIDMTIPPVPAPPGTGVLGTDEAQQPSSSDNTMLRLLSAEYDAQLNEHAEFAATSPGTATIGPTRLVTGGLICQLPIPEITATTSRTGTTTVTATTGVGPPTTSTSSSEATAQPGTCVDPVASPAITVVISATSVQATATAVPAVGSGGVAVFGVALLVGGAGITGATAAAKVMGRRRR